MYLRDKITAFWIIILTALSLTAPDALAQEAKVIEMEGTDQLIFSVEEFTVEPGQEVTVKLTTVSNLPPEAMAHNFVLLAADADAEEIVLASARASENEYIDPEAGDQIIAHTSMAGGGETVEVTFTAPEESGDYPFICTFPGHYQGGMEGTMKVK